MIHYIDNRGAHTSWNAAFLITPLICTDKLDQQKKTTERNMKISDIAFHTKLTLDRDN